MVVELGILDQKKGEIKQSGKTFDLTAVKMELDAVNAYKIVEEGGHKIGYICYTDYVASSHKKWVKSAMSSSLKV